MRKTLQSLVVFGVCMLAVSVAFGGSLNKRGSAAVAQQSIFGIDTPADGATVFGVVDVTGWVHDARGVSRVTLLVDGVAVHDADINLPRTDVRRKYPSFEGLEFPYDEGFATSFLAANYLDGPHTVAIRVHYSTDETAVLGPVDVIVDNGSNQAPFGAIDSPRDPALVGVEEIVSGVWPLAGWAIDDVAIRTTTAPDGKPRADIEVLVDGRVVGQAIYWIPRPDVAFAHPDVAAAFLSGWQMNLDTAQYANGRHEIVVRAWDTDGLLGEIGTRSVWIDNNYATLEPFGRIDWPMPNGHLFSTTCYYPGAISGIEYDPSNHIDWVSGWVVDQNDNERYEGIKYVELLLDGAVIKSTATDCFYLQRFYQDVNCYGKDRPDVLYQYPQFGADAKQSGFFFAVDTDYLLSRGFHRGLHYLAIRVGTQDPTRPAVIVDQIPVVIDCNDEGDDPSFGELEVPVLLQDVRNTQLVKGWVIDYNSVKQLNFYVDGILDGSIVSAAGAKINLLRLDVEAKYPWLPYPFSRYNGFEYNLDTSKYTDGVHQLVIESIDFADYHNFWVQRPLVFNNAN